VLSVDNFGKSNTVGIVQGANDPAAGGTMSFGNSVDYPIVSADTNYTNLQSTLLLYDKVKITTDKEIAMAKITCIKKELDYYGVGYATMETACASWKDYYDACEIRDFPRLVKPPAVPATPKTASEILVLLTKAETDTNNVQMDASSLKKEDYISATLLYAGTLPLPGQSFSAPGVGTTTNGAQPSGSGIIESVNLSGHVLTVTARGIHA
jgi:hypothetical protein